MAANDASPMNGQPTGRKQHNPYQNVMASPSPISAAAEHHHQHQQHQAGIPVARNTMNRMNSLQQLDDLPFQPSLVDQQLQSGDFDDNAQHDVPFDAQNGSPARTPHQMGQLLQFENSMGRSRSRMTPTPNFGSISRLPPEASVGSSATPPGHMQLQQPARPPVGARTMQQRFAAINAGHPMPTLNYFFGAERQAINQTAPIPQEPVSTPIVTMPRAQSTVLAQHAEVEAQPSLCYSNIHLSDSEIDDNEHRIAQRQRQIGFGKDTDGYKRYVEAVPRHERQWDNPAHPITPRAQFKCPKRTFDNVTREWRRRLHLWDEEVESAGRLKGRSTLGELGLEDVPPQVAEDRGSPIPVSPLSRSQQQQSSVATPHPNGTQNPRATTRTPYSASRASPLAATMGATPHTQVRVGAWSHNNTLPHGVAQPPPMPQSANVQAMLQKHHHPQQHAGTAPTSNTPPPLSSPQIGPTVDPEKRLDFDHDHMVMEPSMEYPAAATAAAAGMGHPQYSHGGQHYPPKAAANNMSGSFQYPSGSFASSPSFAGPGAQRNNHRRGSM